MQIDVKNEVPIFSTFAEVSDYKQTDITMFEGTDADAKRGQQDLL